MKKLNKVSSFPASILHTSTAGRYRPVSYPDGPITARYRFLQNAYRVLSFCVFFVSKGNGLDFYFIALFLVFDVLLQQ